jgi:hypothetical protein
MGGVLARPHDLYPDIFSGHFWVTYPYFLPCVAAAGFTWFVWFLAMVFLKEVSERSSSCYALFLT